MLLISMLLIAIYPPEACRKFLQSVVNILLRVIHCTKIYDSTGKVLQQLLACTTTLNAFNGAIIHRH